MADFDRGSIIVPRARCGWALDGGSLHLFAFSGVEHAVDALVAEADRVAREQRAALCVTTLDSEDRWTRALVGCGFEYDYEELYVRDGEVRTEVTLFRMVQSG